MNWKSLVMAIIRAVAYVVLGVSIPNGNADGVVDVVDESEVENGQKTVES